MIYAYLRVSTDQQSVEAQRYAIARHTAEKRLLVDEWVELNISTTKSLAQRRIEELLTRLRPTDLLICSELSRLGRSLIETLTLIEEVVMGRSCRLIFVKEGLDLNPANFRDISNQVMISTFTLVANLHRTYTQERTKEGIAARVSQGAVWGKPKGTVQASQFDGDAARIHDLTRLGLSPGKIVKIHLRYGTRQNLQQWLSTHPA